MGDFRTKLLETARRSLVTMVTSDTPTMVTDILVMLVMVMHMVILTMVMVMVTDMLILVTTVMDMVTTGMATDMVMHMVTPTPTTTRTPRLPTQKHRSEKKMNGWAVPLINCLF